MAGINDRPVDGGLNSGSQSVNGQREAANGFMVNGSNVEEGKTNGASIIPNLDSIPNSASSPTISTRSTETIAADRSTW